MDKKDSPTVKKDRDSREEVERDKVKKDSQQEEEQDSQVEDEVFEEGVDKVEDIPEGQDSKYGV